MIVKFKNQNLLVILVSALLINPMIYNSHANIQRYVIYAVCIVYLLLNNKYISKIISSWLLNFKITNILILGWCVWACLIPIILLSFEFSFISNFIFSIEEIIPLLVIAVFCLKSASKNGMDSLKLFCVLYGFGMCLYVLGTITILLNPNLHDFVLKYLVTNDHDRMLLNYAQYYSRIGWSGIAVFGTSLKCTIAFSCMLFLFRDSINKKKRVLYLFSCIILFIGNIFYARTGMIVCVAIVGCYLMGLMRERNKGKEFFISIVIVIISVLILIQIINKYSDNSVISWMFEFIYNYTKNGRLSSNSTDMMKDSMFFLPKIETLLIGDGYYTYNNSYYMKTDVGFMRLTLFGGVLFCVWLYLTIINYFRKIEKYKKANKSLAMYLLITFAVFEIKGETTIYFLPLIIVLAVLGCIDYRKENNKL